jgi:hypothetical protein
MRRSRRIKSLSDVAHALTLLPEGEDVHASEILSPYPIFTPKTSGVSCDRLHVASGPMALTARTGQGIVSLVRHKGRAQVLLFAVNVTTSIILNQGDTYSIWIKPGSPDNLELVLLPIEARSSPRVVQHLNRRKDKEIKQEDPSTRLAASLAQLSIRINSSCAPTSVSALEGAISLTSRRPVLTSLIVERLYLRLRARRHNISGTQTTRSDLSDCLTTLLQLIHLGFYTTTMTRTTIFRRPELSHPHHVRLRAESRLTSQVRVLKPRCRISPYNNNSNKASYPLDTRPLRVTIYSKEDIRLLKTYYNLPKYT